MMARRQVLRVMPCCSPAVRGQGGDKAGPGGDKPSAVRGQAPRGSAKHSPSFGLSEAQVQAFGTMPAPA